MAAPQARVFLDEDSSPPVRGFLHQPAEPSGEGLVLTHGAGGNCQTPFLVAVAAAFAALGITVLRFDLPYRQKRPLGPPSPSTATLDQDGIRAAAVAMKKLASGRVFGGGHSYGGRQTSMLAATGPEIFAGLLLTSYPLHPPGRPQQLRTAHFPQLRVPCLFVQGDHDPFASPEEISSALKLIPAPTRLMVIEGGGHSLVPRRTDASVLAGKIADAFREFLLTKA